MTDVGFLAEPAQRERGGGITPHQRLIVAFPLHMLNYL